MGSSLPRKSTSQTEIQPSVLLSPGKHNPPGGWRDPAVRIGKLRSLILYPSARERSARINITSCWRDDHPVQPSRRVRLAETRSRIPADLRALLGNHNINRSVRKAGLAPLMRPRVSRRVLGRSYNQPVVSLHYPMRVLPTSHKTRGDPGLSSPPTHLGIPARSGGGRRACRGSALLARYQVRQQKQVRRGRGN